MLRKASKRLFLFASIALSLSLLSGCYASRYYGKTPPDPGKAIIVGAITEAFLSQPHGLIVDIEQQGEPETHLRLTTLANEDDQPSPNLLGHLYMYEVPPGNYAFTTWKYEYFAGHSMARATPVVFTVQAGEVAYIGDQRADDLNLCLSNLDKAEGTLQALKRKYPVLNGRTIVNLTDKTAFQDWPSSDAKDNGKGLCAFWASLPAAPSKQ
ncbi:hypothetical protein [Pseudomonas cremoricolorata]|uniref:hypothetical protein n=1 Tax=Pseudomonas cremoricolorata TaxID=157783 RepID=UPI0006769FF3|nr:hypothetical protein [Pseudomonas cremoricolorata]